MSVIKHVYKIFDRFEDIVRIRLSHHPIPYAFIGGVAVVLFWRAVWEISASIPILQNPWHVLILSIFILLGTGLFVSFFIGDRILLSGLKREKKLAEKTETEIEIEKNILDSLDWRLENLEKDMKEIKELLKR